mmetsp:Transcript_23873/g.59460  ORF Transcript_23873/g.59460 Transcript_23873/m.59460 type:complete len:190 (+) Transcript_23873:85-654(+)
MPSALPPDEDDELAEGCYINGRWMQGGLAPWHPTDDTRVQESLTAAGLESTDLLLELGCGDGKICCAAAKVFGCRAVGVELDEAMVQVACSRLADFPERLQALVEIRHGDLLDKAALWTEDPPTCVTMALMPDHYDKLEPLLEGYVSAGVKLIVFHWELKGEHWKQRLVRDGNGWWLYHQPLETRGLRC